MRYGCWRQGRAFSVLAMSILAAGCSSVIEEPRVSRPPVIDSLEATAEWPVPSSCRRTECAAGHPEGDGLSREAEMGAYAAPSDDSGGCGCR